MKNKKGFSLVELLATIIILGIVIVIAVPNIIKIV
ncbi:MAG: prepilin-type N-terminal cleavage/methylation domain-containing protein, partial [Bacilli bacterium]